jgi:methionyl-tRNA formyltransferase
MSKELNIYLLAYPDNPVGKVFIETFRRKNVPIKGIVVEEKKGKSNRTRLMKKVQKVGLTTALKRILQVYWLKLTKRNIVHLAEKYEIDVLRVNRFNSKKCAALLDTLDIDLFAIVSAPILKDYVFNKAKSGCLNAHPGWLPKYRGLGGNAYAVQNGDSPGVTVHFIDEGIDTGNIIVREKLSILRGDTIAKINDRAMARGAELMADVIHAISEDRLELPDISEDMGEMYYAMPFAKVKDVNKKLMNMDLIES